MAVTAILWPLCILALALLAESSFAGVSRITDLILRSLNPVPHEKGQIPLPTLPFRWPNGQGTEKFFQGTLAAQRWRRENGSIYQIWSGLRPEIVLTKPHQVEQYYRDSHKHVKAKNNNSGWLFGEVLGDCVGLVSLQAWRNQRKFVEKQFSRPEVMLYTKSVLQQAKNFVDELRVGEQRTLDPAVDLQFYPFMVVANMLFGQLDRLQMDILLDLAPMREELFKEVIRGGINRLSIAQYVPWSGVPLLRKFQTRWQSFVEDAYQKAATSSPEAPIVTLWQAMLNGQISKREVCQTLDESLYANLDVTTSAVSWSVILIAQNPEQQALLRQELAENDHAREAYINKQDTLLAAAIVEAARLRPILAFSNPESATEDKIIDGYLIKRGTEVIVDAAAINIDNPFWGPDAKRYDPSRHAGLKAAESRYNLWRFGFGPRQCLGQHVAERMLRGVVAELLSRYELSAAKVDEAGGMARKDESWVGLPNSHVTCRLLKA